MLKSAVQLASDFRHALRSSGTEGPKQPRVAESLPAAKTGRRGQVQEGIGGVDVVVAEVHVEDTARTRGGGVQEGGACGRWAHKTFSEARRGKVWKSHTAGKAHETAVEVCTSRFVGVSVSFTNL